LSVVVLPSSARTHPGSLTRRADVQWTRRRSRWRPRTALAQVLERDLAADPCVCFVAWFWPISSDAPATFTVLLAFIYFSPRTKRRGQHYDHRCGGVRSSFFVPVPDVLSSSPASPQIRALDEQRDDDLVKLLTKANSSPGEVPPFGPPAAWLTCWNVSHLPAPLLSYAPRDSCRAAQPGRRPVITTTAARANVCAMNEQPRVPTSAATGRSHSCRCEHIPSRSSCSGSSGPLAQHGSSPGPVEPYAAAVPTAVGPPP